MSPNKDDEELTIELPPLPQWRNRMKRILRAPSSVAGPTHWSNWVIPNMMIAGAYPAAQPGCPAYQLLKAILQAGADTFVMLQSEIPFESDKANRARCTIPVYEPMARRVAAKLGLKPPEFIHYPIVDGDIGPDADIIDLANHLTTLICRGRVLYVHCWGGHGRTGTLVAIILARMYSISADEAMARVQAYHDVRCNGLENNPSPQFEVQREQVRRLVPILVESDRAAAAAAATAAGGAAGAAGASDPQRTAPASPLSAVPVARAPHLEPVPEQQTEDKDTDTDIDMLTAADIPSPSISASSTPPRSDTYTDTTTVTAATAAGAPRAPIVPTIPLAPRPPTSGATSGSGGGTRRVQRPGLGTKNDKENTQPAVSTTSRVTAATIPTPPTTRPKTQEGGTRRPGPTVQPVPVPPRTGRGGVVSRPNPRAAMSRTTPAPTPRRNAPTRPQTARSTPRPGPPRPGTAGATTRRGASPRLAATYHGSLTRRQRSASRRRTGTGGKGKGKGKGRAKGKGKGKKLGKGKGKRATMSGNQIHTWTTPPKTRDTLRISSGILSHPPQSTLPPLAAGV